MTMTVGKASTKIHDFHVHLHGCLTADDVFELGKKVWESRIDGLNWYANEYRQATGIAVRPFDYWLKPDGKERLKFDFEFKNPADFPSFQARFNLLIALFPITPTDTSIIDRIVSRDISDKLIGHREYRLFIPPRFNDNEVFNYIDSQANKLLEILSAHKRTDELCLAFSLSRNPDKLKSQYHVLKEWQRTQVLKKSPTLDLVTGIDFCGDESSCTPSSLSGFIKKLHEDNRAFPDQALALLYQVGEQWHAIPPETAIQWVVDAAKLGAHRLGHALAVRISPEILASAKSNTGKLSAGDIHRLQRDAQSQLRDFNAIIEICPSSNQLVSGSLDPMAWTSMTSMDHMEFVMGTDNPGVLSVDIDDEWVRFKEIGKLVQKNEEPRSSEVSFEKFFSAQLCGRAKR